MSNLLRWNVCGLSWFKCYAVKFRKEIQRWMIKEYKDIFRADNGQIFCNYCDLSVEWKLQMHTVQKHLKKGGVISQASYVKFIYLDFQQTFRIFKTIFNSKSISIIMDETTQTSNTNVQTTIALSPSQTISTSTSFSTPIITITSISIIPPTATSSSTSKRGGLSSSQTNKTDEGPEVTTKTVSYRRHSCYFTLLRYKRSQSSDEDEKVKSY
ncbi:hypothetical protein Glove_25g12 [Diversispora epigaea]|uniref:Uncharacterized protein n=1 Tax=Diversispora epigaea TaxID=1348612 RepID=A0A397JN34_9GLOM|nr:hypothetical protein Glove_25g12 [Diversispora epigaea]